MAESLVAFAAEPYGLTRLVLAAFLGGILPAIFWLWFWLKEDRLHPEPKRLLFYAFVGGAVAVPIAFILESSLNRVWPGGLSLPSVFFPAELINTSFWLSVGLVAGWAVIEEGLKFLGARLTVFRGRDFDEPVDTMIYLITVALGFAAVENTLQLFQLILAHTAGSEVIVFSSLRFLGATVLHVASSATLGAILALGYCAHPRHRPVYWVGGFIAATLLHLIFNIFIILDTASGIPTIYYWLWLWIVFVILMFEKVKSLTCKINI